MPDNHLMAEHRLRLLGKRLQKDSQLCERYTASMHELLEKKYAEAVNSPAVKRQKNKTFMHFMIQA